MEDYKKIDVLSYVREGIRNGSLVPRQAVKFARIIARQGSVGEKVITWSVDQDGKPIVEKEAEVCLDKETQKPGWIVSKVSSEGEKVVDEHGHINEWIIDDSTFHKKYEIDPENPSLYRPVGGPQIFVQLSENIIINQWGNDELIAAGGYINITKVDDMYGISRRDFADTYEFVEGVPTISF